MNGQENVVATPIEQAAEALCSMPDAGPHAARIVVTTFLKAAAEDERTVRNALDRVWGETKPTYEDLLRGLAQDVADKPCTCPRVPTPKGDAILFSESDCPVHGVADKTTELGGWQGVQLEDWSTCAECQRELPRLSYCLMDPDYKSVCVNCAARHIEEAQRG